MAQTEPILVNTTPCRLNGSRAGLRLQGRPPVPPQARALRTRKESYADLLLVGVEWDGGIVGDGVRRRWGKRADLGEPDDLVDRRHPRASSPIRIGATAQASATATLSSGQSQPITAGWQSDAQSVATVTDSGLVTGAGDKASATIFVLHGGRQGQQVMRVVPDYQGQWSGALRVTSCTDSGEWARIGFCQEFAVGGTDGSGLGLAQSGESLTASPNYR